MKIEDLFSKQAQLEATFPTEVVKQRDAGFGGRKLDYIPIDQVITRMNEVFPLGYTWLIKQVFPTMDSVIVVGSLSIQLDADTCITREGIGADAMSKDVDKACKTAMAEAFKKACNTLGIALYLWDEDARLRLAQDRENLRQGNFTSGQLTNMKTVRQVLALNTDAALNTFLGEKYPAAKTKADLKPTNIEKFFDYAWSLPQLKGAARCSA